jgi:hypothetical protein
MYLQEIMVNKYIELYLPPLDKRQFRLWSQLQDYCLRADMGVRKDLSKPVQYQLFFHLINLRGTILVTGKLKRLKDLFSATPEDLRGENDRPQSRNPLDGH